MTVLECDFECDRHAASSPTSRSNQNQSNEAREPSKTTGNKSKKLAGVMIVSLPLIPKSWDVET